MRITVKRDDASTCHRWSRGTRGAEIRIDGHRVGSVYHSQRGWVWSVGSDRYHLTHHAGQPLPTYEAAKAAGAAHVKTHAVLATKYAFETPISGVVTTEVYALTDHEAREMALRAATSVIASLPTALSWGAPGEPKCIRSSQPSSAAPKETDK